MLRSPKVPVSDRSGKSWAIETPTSAVAACRLASASRMSFRPKFVELCYRNVVPIERITHAVLLFAVLSDR